MQNYVGYEKWSEIFYITASCVIEFLLPYMYLMTVSLLHRLKPLASLYVDTTFCHPNSFLIPSRRTIIKVVCDLVTEWTSKGSNHVVHFTPRANYGHEPLLKEVAQTLGCKVWSLLQFNII